MLDLSAITACLILGAEPALIGAVIETESNWQSNAVHVNQWSGTTTQGADIAQAVTAAKDFIGKGYSVDIGVMQINSNNLASFGVSIGAAFDVCTNVRMGEAILLAGIDRALKAGHKRDHAIKVGLSYYNTGHAQRGFDNGYVDTVWRAYRTDDEARSRESDTAISWNTSIDLLDYSDANMHALTPITTATTEPPE